MSLPGRWRFSCVVIIHCWGIQGVLWGPLGAARGSSRLGSPSLPREPLFPLLFALSPVTVISQALSHTTEAYESS